MRKIPSLFVRNLSIRWSVSGDWPGGERKVAPRIDPNAPLMAPTGRAAAALATRLKETKA